MSRTHKHIPTKAIAAVVVEGRSNTYTLHAKYVHALCHAHIHTYTRTHKGDGSSGIRMKIKLLLKQLLHALDYVTVGVHHFELVA